MTMAPSPPGVRPATPPARPRELQDPLNRHLFHPLAARLARWLARWPVSPDLVSLAGGMMVVLAALAYAWPGAHPWPALLGLALHLSWHVLDGADGDLARLRGTASPRGEVIDGVCDYVGHIVLYVVLALLAQRQIGLIAWGLAALAGASHVLQSTFYEAQRRQYQHWVYGTAWLETARSAPGAAQAGGILGMLGQSYLALNRWLAGDAAAPVKAALANPATSAVIRQRLRDQAGPLLRPLTLLSNNYRTLAVGIAMLAAMPWAYFALGIVVLNLVLLWARRRIRLRLQAISAEVDQAGIA